MTNLKTQIKLANEKQNEIKALENKYAKEISECKKEVTKLTKEFIVKFNNNFKELLKEYDLEDRLKYSKVYDYEDAFEKIEKELQEEFTVNAEDIFHTYFEFSDLHNVTKFNEDYIEFTCKEYCGEFDEYYDHTIPTEWLFNFSKAELFIRKILECIINEDKQEEDKRALLKEEQDRKLYEELKNRFEK